MSRVWVFTSKTESCVQCAQYQSTIEAVSRGHGGGVLYGEEVVVMGLGDVIEQGGGFALQN